MKIFSDKTIFTVDQVYNCRNDRWISTTPGQVKGVIRTKHPAQVMVLGIPGSDGKKMPPFFFKPGERIGTEAYYKVLRYTVLPWIKATYPEGNYAWTQDGAPSHTANKVQKFCKENMVEFWAKDLWPPSSPDLNPLNFFGWCAIKKDACATPHPNLDSLEAAILRSWANYPEDAVKMACESFRPRIEAVIKKMGDHIK